MAIDRRSGDPVWNGDILDNMEQAPRVRRPLVLSLALAVFALGTVVAVLAGLALAKGSGSAAPSPSSVSR